MKYPTWAIVFMAISSAIVIAILIIARPKRVTEEQIREYKNSAEYRAKHHMDDVVVGKDVSPGKHFDAIHGYVKQKDKGKK